MMYIRKFCPPPFHAFCFLPSIGASRGILVVCKSSLFVGTEVIQNIFAMSIEFTSLHNGATWILTVVYGPCVHEEKRNFVDQFDNIQMPHEVDWLVVADFNLIKNPSDRNRLGGNATEMLGFNEAINSVGIMEIPLHGRKFTWTNKQLPLWWKGWIGCSPPTLGLLPVLILQHNP